MANRRPRPSNTSDFLAAEDGGSSRMAPLIASNLPLDEGMASSTAGPRSHDEPPRTQERSTLRRIRSRLARLVSSPRTVAAPNREDDSAEAQRRRWATEKAMLIADCTAARTEAANLAKTLEGWENLVRDILFYGGLHGRVADMTALFAEQLRSSLGEVEGVHEVTEQC